MFHLYAKYFFVQQNLHLNVTFVCCLQRWWPKVSTQFLGWWRGECVIWPNVKKKEFWLVSGWPLVGPICHMLTVRLLLWFSLFAVLDSTELRFKVAESNGVCFVLFSFLLLTHSKTICILHTNSPWTYVSTHATEPPRKTSPPRSLGAARH